MEEDYTEPNLRSYFIQAFPDKVIISNTFAVQDRSTAVCGRYAVLVGQLFLKEGIDGAIRRMRELFDSDTINNDRKVLELVPLVTGGGSDILRKIYYSPRGYWKGHAAIKKLAKEAGVPEDTARKWLQKQPIWQIYLPPPPYIPRPKFDITTPNEVHQADILYLPHDTVGGRTYKYALTIVDVASRYKEAQALTDKTSTQTAKAMEFIYKRSPLNWPKLLQADAGSEFRGAVEKLCQKNGTEIRRGIAGVHRNQGIVERMNRTLAERLFTYQYDLEMKSKTRNTEWVLRLPEVIKALNNQVTRLVGLKPALAIQRKSVTSQPAAPASRPVGFHEQVLPNGVAVRYLYAPGEIESDERRRATDPIWSVDVYLIDRTVVKTNEPVRYYLLSKQGIGPRRSFVREELQPVTEDDSFETLSPGAKHASVSCQTFPSGQRTVFFLEMIG